MAQKVVVNLLDDIDGSEAVETVAFSYKGTDYTIDLNVKHAAKLDKNLAEFVEHAQKVGATSMRQRPAGTRKRAAKGPSSREANQRIREWAKAQRIEIAERGRIPADVVAKAEAAGVA